MACACAVASVNRGLDSNTNCETGLERADALGGPTTRHEPRTCLAETDMAGLHALYPTCNELIPTEISCVKATRLSGWLRLASVVGLPFLVAVVLIMVPLHFIRRRDQRKIAKLSTDVQASANPGCASPTAPETCVELSRAPN